MRFINTLVMRLVLLQLLIYAVLLPALFYGLETQLRTDVINSFTRQSRAYASSIRRELELSDTLDSAGRTIAFLDGSVEGAGCAYAAIRLNGRLLGSSASETPGWIESRGDDVAFTRSPDAIYAVALPLDHGDARGFLYLGFDKRPASENIRVAARRIGLSLTFYGIASLAAAVLLAKLMARPLRYLRAASRKVAGGDITTQLDSPRGVTEIVDLAQDLDLMRRKLVGTSEQLRSEIRRRQEDQEQRALLESQLRHEQRLVTMGTFAGGLAHEFNNILVPIILYSEEALEDMGGDHPLRDNLERILQAATRAGKVVRQILAFSRPVAERQPVLIDVGAVTREALELTRALMPSNIELRVETADEPQFVLGDATLLSQVVLNLCSNAIHAMHERGGLLYVRVAPGIGQMIQLRVQDTGRGMNLDIQERIFEPFFTMREVGEGTGLGLSIVHGIVASMGGTIVVSSTLDVGTEFIVSMPSAVAPRFD